MIYDRSQRPRTASLASLVVEHTSGTQPTAYLPTIGILHIIMMIPPNFDGSLGAQHIIMLQNYDIIKIENGDMI